MLPRTVHSHRACMHMSWQINFLRSEFTVLSPKIDRSAQKHIFWKMKKHIHRKYVSVPNLLETFSARQNERFVSTGSVFSYVGAPKKKRVCEGTARMWIFNIVLLSKVTNGTAGIAASKNKVVDVTAVQTQNKS